MKGIKETKTLVRSGVQKSTECGMVVNAKAFEMLARQYSDPVKAVLQEISANAADSHIRAGIPDRPFEVKLPNSLDPHFRVRDYGVSMSRETIYGVYINYMKSDKTDTNSETGFFGIGSKTPLAYTDSFNIKTYLNGKMNLYTLGYNENGIPELNEFAEYDTDEENGVEISFAVKPDDFKVFAKRAEHVYSFFDVPPIVAGVTEFETKTFTKVLEGSNWFMFKESLDANSYVVMGNIGYPLDGSDLNESYSSDYRGLVTNGVILKIPIGTASMTPSRESLEFNENTIKYIKSQLDIVKDEIAESVREQIDACPNKWQARIKANEISSIFGWRLNQIVDLAHWRKEELPAKVHVPVEKRYSTEGHGNGKVYARREIEQAINIRENVVVVIKDIGTKFESRSKHFAQQHEKTVFLISDENTETQLRDRLGCDQENIIFYASELPDPPKDPSKTYSRGGKGRKITTTAMKFCPNRDGNNSSGRNYDSQYWQQTEIDVKATANETHVYVDWNNYEYSCDRVNADGVTPLRYNVVDIFKRLNKLNIPLPELYGIKKAQKNKISKRSNWIALDSWLDAKIKELYDNDDFKAKIKFNQSLDDVELEDEINALMESKTVDFIDEDSDFVKFAKFVLEYGKQRSHRENANRIDYMAVRDLVDLCRYDLKLNTVKTKETNKGVTMFKNVKEKYPLVVSFMTRLYYGNIKDQADSIVCTVNAIDSYLK
tara:strand:+ start:1249 stop:3399 length:2151 start_codon:yes stop_codon:yes gene_type:complete